MAEIWPDEGLDAVLNYFPTNNSTIPANTWIALFTAFTASTVGATNNPIASYTEPSGGAYARQTISSASWGDAAATSPVADGRKSTAAQVTFPTATASWGTINGFTLAGALTTGFAYFAANFDDTTAVPITSNDVIKVTPTIQYNH